MAEYKFTYGRGYIGLEIPDANVLAELKPASLQSVATATEIITTALENPIGFDEPKNVVVAPVSTTLVLPDKTRNCGANLFMPDLLDYLNQVGIRDTEITILLANGSHEPNTENEIINILGQETMSRVAVRQHDSHDDKMLDFLGKTRFGTPVQINRTVTEAEQVIAVGTAVHHYFAGFGGGAKMINPGCAGYETITHNHAFTIDESTGGLNRNCLSGLTEGNPVQEDIRDSMRLIKKPLLLETVLNEKSQITAAFWGELWQTHQHACELVDKVFRVRINEKADIVVAGCGGFPKDINLIQAHKSIYNAYQAVKPGGVVLIFAECSQGIGSQTFLEWFFCPGIDTMLKKMSAEFKLNATTALSLRTKAEDATIILVSGLEVTLLKKLGLYNASSASEGWNLAKSYLAESFTCYVMPNASLTLPEGE